MTCDKKVLTWLIVIAIIANAGMTVVSFASGWPIPIFSVVAWYFAVNACFVAAWFAGRSA